MLWTHLQASLALALALALPRDAVSGAAPKSNFVVMLADVCRWFFAWIAALPVHAFVLSVPQVTESRACCRCLPVGSTCTSWVDLG